MEKRSIFAERMLKKRASKSGTQEPLPKSFKTETKPGSSKYFGDQSYITSGADADSIHIENIEKLSNMTKEELMEEQKKIISELDPELINFIKNLRSKKNEQPMEIEAETTREKPTKQTLRQEENEIEEVKELANKYPHMDIIENDKLKWIGELSKETKPPDEPYPARFNFEGELLPYMDKGEGVLKGLHNHGEEQERPGYSLQELIQLSRSSVLQQRIIAIQTLAKIMAKASQYDECFDTPLLPTLLEADMFLLLRFSLDDTALPIVSAATIAICNLVVNHTDELCLDVMLGTQLGIYQPSLGVVLEKDLEIKHLKDQELLKLDIIEGAVRTNILDRFKYMMISLPLEPLEIKHALKTITRITRHSYTVAEKVFETPGLLDAVKEILNQRNKNSYFPEALKLFRILSSRSIVLAKKIVETYSILNILEIAPGHPEAMQLTLESFYTWQVMLNYNININSISNLTPVLVKLLKAHIDLTNLDSARSDIEHGVALISTLTAVAKVDKESVSHFVVFVSHAAAKWATQYTNMKNPSFSASKLVGSCLEFFSNVINQLDSSLLVPIVEKFFTQGSFNHCIELLIQNSWLLQGKIISCPENLPCLGSIPPSLTENSSFPFIFSLNSFLLALNNKKLISMFVSNEAIVKYINLIFSDTNVKNRSTHWYARQEINFLANLVQLYSISEVEHFQNDYRKLSFLVLTLIQSGDKYLLRDIISNVIFNRQIFRDKEVQIVTENLKNLNLDGFGIKKQKELHEAISNLNEIKIFYEDVIDVNKYNPPVVPNTLTGLLQSTEAALPSDWMFVPILKIFDEKKESEISFKTATLCLQWFIILEELLPEVIDSISPAAKYCRLCCLYLASNDLFRSITPKLEIVLSYITKNIDKLNFKKPIPGLTSFFDFYSEVIDHYVGVSYCDTVFGQYILLPLAQKHSPEYKKMVWSEQAGVLRVLRTPISDVNMKHYLEPQETDFDLLKTYLHALATGRIHESWCPVLYNVAVHHVSNYIANNNNEISAFLLERVKKLGNQELKNVLLQPKMSCDKMN